MTQEDRERLDAIVFLPLREAAARLALSEAALQAFVRRHAIRRDGLTVCDLAPGVTASKLGHHWRVRFVVPSPIRARLCQEETDGETRKVG